MPTVMSEVSVNGYPPPTSLQLAANNFSHKYTDLLLSSNARAPYQSSSLSTSGPASSGGPSMPYLGQAPNASNSNLVGIESKLGELSLAVTGSTGGSGGGTPGGPGGTGSLLLHTSASSPDLTSINNNYPGGGGGGAGHNNNPLMNGFYAAHQATAPIPHGHGHVTPASAANYLLTGGGECLSNSSNQTAASLNSNKNPNNPTSMAPASSSSNTGGGATSNLQSSGAADNLSGFRRLMSHRAPLLTHRYTGDSSRDTVLNQFRDVLHTLTVNPATFDEIVPYLVEALNCARVKPDTSLSLAHLLVSWSILEGNFRYTGAKLSHYLCLPEQLNFSFKGHFFSCVRMEVDRMDGLIKDQTQSNHLRLEGVILFISELYLNMGNVDIDAYGVVTVTRIKFLRNVLKDAILKILELSPFEKPFLIVGRVLKLTGAALDESDLSDPGNHCSKTDRIYTHIEAIQQDPNTSQTVRQLYGRVLQLRKSHWATEPQPSYNMAKDPTALHATLDTPVFFLDDGTPIPAHEADYTESDHEFDSAAAAAYFMMQQQQQHRSGVGHHGGGGNNGGGGGSFPFDPHSTAAASGLSNASLAGVHELTAEEDAAFELFLQQQQL